MAAKDEGNHLKQSYSNHIDDLRSAAFGQDGKSAFDKSVPVNLRSTKDGEVFYRIQAVERADRSSSQHWVVPEKQWHEWEKSGELKNSEANLCLPLRSRSESGRYHVDRITANAGCRLAEGQVGPASEGNVIHANARPARQAILTAPPSELSIESVATLDVQANRLEKPEARRGTRSAEYSRVESDRDRFRGMTDSRKNITNANDNDPARDIER